MIQCCARAYEGRTRIGPSLIPSQSPSHVKPLSPDERVVVAEVIRTRRTIHTFLPEPPPEAIIHRALEQARWAPNHKLTEPWRFYLVGPETAEALARLNAEIVTERKGEQAGRNKLARWRTMPGWLVITCRRSSDPLREREDYAACCCAAQNLMLALWSEGVGTKWSTGPATRDPRFQEIMGIDPEEEMVVGLFWYGYPAEQPEKPRRSVDEVLRRLP